MTLQSMTGFARVEGALANSSWTWEIKSVNGKGLDIRWRLPNGMDFLERELRNQAAKELTRGNLQVNLTYESDEAENLPRLNEKSFNAVLEIIEKIKTKTELTAPTADGLLAIRGVLEIGRSAELDEAETALRNQSLISTFQAAVSELAQARLTEGKAICDVLKSQVDEISRLTDLINKDASRTPEAIKQNLSAKLDRLLENNTELDEQRLMQEVAILATKADLQEELDRLAAHVASAYDLLNSEQAVGRKLDFLAQEFNRECNTICSKSNASSVTQLGLEMKVVVDQFREQIQNIQ